MKCRPAPRAGESRGSRVVRDCTACPAGPLEAVNAGPLWGGSCPRAGVPWPGPAAPWLWALCPSVILQAAHGLRAPAHRGSRCGGASRTPGSPVQALIPPNTAHALPTPTKLRRRVLGDTSEGSLPESGDDPDLRKASGVRISGTWGGGHGCPPLASGLLLADVSFPRCWGEGWGRGSTQHYPPGVQSGFPEERRPLTTSSGPWGPHTGTVNRLRGPRRGEAWPPWGLGWGA